MSTPTPASGTPDPTGGRLAGPSSSSISSEVDPHVRAANTPSPPLPQAPPATPSPNPVSVNTNAPIPVTGPQCDARGRPAPASANSPPRASVPGRPPSCGSRNPSQVCSPGQCCSSEGWCGPTAFAAGVYIENGVAMNQSAAEALYCAAPQGDWREWTPAGPCSVLGVSYPWDPTKAPPLSAPNLSPSVPTLPPPPVPTSSGGQTMTSSGGTDSPNNLGNGSSAASDTGLSTGTAIVLGAILGIVLASVLSAGMWWWWMRRRAQGVSKGHHRRSRMLPPGSWEDEVAVLKRQSGQPSVAQQQDSDMMPMMIPGSSQRTGSGGIAAGRVDLRTTTSASAHEQHGGPHSIPQHYHRSNHTQGSRNHHYPPQQPYPHHVVGPSRSAGASGSLGYLGTGISSKDPLLSDIELSKARPSTPPSAIQPALLPISISSPSPFGSLFRGPSWDTNATSVPEQYPSAYQLKSPSRPITAPPQAVDMESPSFELKPPATPALLLAQAINSIDEADLGCAPRQESQASRSLAAILNGSMSCPNLAQRPAAPGKDSFMSSTSGSASTLHLHQQHRWQSPFPDTVHQPSHYSLLGYSTYSGPRPPMPPVPESPRFHPQLSTIALSAEDATTPSAVGSNLSTRTQRTTSILSRRDSLPPGMLANLASSAGVGGPGSSEAATTSQAPTPRPAPVQPALAHSDGVASVVSGSFVSAAGSDPLLDNDAPPESLLPRFTSALATYGAMPGVRIARQSFAGAEEDELDLRVGDAVMVVQIYSDAWCQGTNQRSGLSGVFPLCALDPMGAQDKVVAALLDDLADLPSIDIE